jgi:hypothetical protein
MPGRNGIDGTSGTARAASHPTRRLSESERTTIISRKQVVVPTFPRIVVGMCRYAFTPGKLHFACVRCRITFKRHPPPADAAPHTCPRCSRATQCAGRDFAAPRRADVKAWAVVAELLEAGLRFEGFEPCGCGREPKARPRTRRELVGFRVEAARLGVPLRELLDARR